MQVVTNPVTHLLKWICVFAWLLMLVLTLYSFSGSPKEFHMGGVDVSVEITHRQLVVLARTLLGLGLAVLALLAKRLWPLLLIASSLLYLTQWYFGGPMRLVGVIDGYRLLCQTSSKLDLRLDFAIRDLLVPSGMALAFVGSIAYLIVARTKRSPRRS
jgi:hypothetical protein